MSKDVQFNLRIPAELKGKIENAAKTNNRSINAEAMNRLEQSFIKPLIIETISESSNYLFQLGILRGELVIYEMALSQSTALNERTKYRQLIDATQSKLAFFREKLNEEQQNEIKNLPYTDPF